MLGRVLNRNYIKPLVSRLPTACTVSRISDVDLEVLSKYYLFHIILGTGVGAVTGGSIMSYEFLNRKWANAKEGNPKAPTMEFLYSAQNYPLYLFGGIFAGGMIGSVMSASLPFALPPLAVFTVYKYVTDTPSS
jgi:hypothetical protein